jgi:hypothetical protein
MKDQLENGKGFLKDRLGNYRVEPPEKVWESISSRLGNRNRRLWIIIGLSAAATITLAVTLGINFFGPGSGDGKSISENRVVENGTNGQEGKLEEKVMQAMEDIEGGAKAEQKSVTMESGQETEPNEHGTVNKIVKESLAFQTDGEETSQQAPSEKVGGNKNMEELAVEKVEKIIPEQNKYPVQDSQKPGDEYGEPGERDKKWLLGASLSPLYSFRDAEAMALSGAAGHESGLLSYAGGIQVGYRAGKRLAIESGVFYAKMGISIGAPGIQLFDQSFDFAPLAEKANRSNVKAIANTVGNIVSNSGDIYVNNYKLNGTSEENSLDFMSASDVNADQGIRQHLNYLEVPLNLRYTVIDRSVELQLVGGMSTNFLVNNYVSMETSDGTEDVGYLTNIRSVNYSGNAGLGVVYHVMDHFSLMMEPRFRYFLNSVNDPSLPSTRPYAFGIYTGLNYIF